MTYNKPRYLIKDHKTRREFSICPRWNQARKELVIEVDQLIGHLNYSATNYTQNIWTAGCFGGLE